MDLQSRLAQAENAVKELKGMRAEDAKANEKVVSIIAFREQCWRNERKRLQHDNELLQQKLNILLDKTRVNVVDPDTSCLKCKESERLIVDLKDKLTEKEFLLITATEEAKAEQIERKEVAGKLAAAGMLAAYVKEKLDHQMKEHDACLVNYGLEVSNLMAEQKELQTKLERMVIELKLSKHVAAELKGSLESYQRANGTLHHEIKNLKEDISSKDTVISVMLRRNCLATAENLELSRKASVAKLGKRYAENERDNWRRIAEGHINEYCTKLSKPGCSFGRRAGSIAAKISEMQRFHAEHVYNLQRIHKSKQKDLEYQVQYYLARLLTLENSILCGLSEDLGSGSPETWSLQKHEMSQSSTSDVSTGTVKDCAVSAPQSQLSRAKNVVLQFMDGPSAREMSVGEWKKFYTGAKATVNRLQSDNAAKLSGEGFWIHQRVESNQVRHSAEIEQRHCRELDALERQMRAKDVRLEFFRSQLLIIHESAKRMKAEIEELKQQLQKATQQCLKEECLRKEIELEIRRELFKQFHANAQPHVGFSSKTKVEERKSEVNLIDLFALLNRGTHCLKLPEGSLIMALQQAEAELYEKDMTLAVLEAKLVQAALGYEKEKRLRKRSFYLENTFLETLAGDEGPAIKHAALYDSRMQVRALSQDTSWVHRNRLSLCRDYKFGSQSSFRVSCGVSESLTRVQFIVFPHVDQPLKMQKVLGAHPLVYIYIIGNKLIMCESCEKGPIQNSLVRLRYCPQFKSGDNGENYVLETQCQQAQMNEELACCLSFLGTSVMMGNGSPWQLPFTTDSDM